MSRALLAYDGSPKAREGLYAAAYLAGTWKIPLVILSVGDEEAVGTLLRDAQAYLEQRGVPGIFEQAKGPVAETILRYAEAQGIELLILGGYGFGPLREAVLGSVVDQVLRESRCPILLCR